MGYKVPIVAAFIFILITAYFSVLPVGSIASDNTFKDKAKAIAAEITGMRSARAAILLSSRKTFKEVRVESFKRTCGPVAKRARAIAKEQSVQIRHVALKYRNPKNRATDEEARMIEMFDSDRSVTSKLDRIEMEGKIYKRYSAPIFVETACLMCHGDKGARPGFVLKKYGQDRAWGFGVGDIRGIISVLSPL